MPTIPIHRHAFEIPADVVDENGHVNNVVYVRWMQEAAVRHSDAVGCTQATREAGALWVVRSHRIEYLRPAFAGETIEVSTWVADFRRVISLRRYEFVRTTDQVVLARGETDWVFVDAKTGRPRAIPESVWGRFELRPGEPGARLGGTADDADTRG
jgi:acyl-CoA thioester hydrolase